MLKNKIVVGIIPTYNLTNDENDPYQDRASFVRMYEQMIVDCGAIPIGLLNINAQLYLDICDAYLWPGGTYIQRSYYQIFDDAIKNHKPILGICLGMQSITTYFNILDDMKNNKDLSLEETYQSNKNVNPFLIKLDETKQVNHNRLVTKDKETIKNALHKVIIKKDTILYNIYKQEEIYMPSMHRVTPARLTNNIIISAKSEDDVIEAIEYHENDYYILGVQFHPELIKDHKLFEWLVNSAYKNNKH